MLPLQVTQPPYLLSLILYLGTIYVDNNILEMEVGIYSGLLRCAMQFLRLGRAGYTRIIHGCATVAEHLAQGIEDTRAFTVLSVRGLTSDWLPACMRLAIVA